MKRILMAGLLLGAAVLAQAQTVNDALNIADNHYFGTARSVALGNAMVALGGDLGSVGLNPAGAAVAGYSQFTFTPGFSIHGMKTTFTAPESSSSVVSQTNKSGIRLPNVGVMMNFDRERRTGLKSFTFGFVANTTNDYADRAVVRGQNHSTSMFGGLAQLANGYPYQDFEDGTSSYMDLSTAFNTYLIDLLSGYDDMYIGATENKYVNEDGSIDIELADGIWQDYHRRHMGYKTDMLMNFAMNFSDRFYVGVNLGMPVYEYRDELTFTETPVKEGLFQTGFREGVYNEYSSKSGAGIYAKLGVIWKPVGGLRLGLTYQTPTYMSITEYYGFYGKSDQWDFDTERYKVREEYSPEGEYNYSLVTPGFFSFGAAYTMPFGFVSADFEKTDYSTMRFSTYEGYYSHSFDDVNASIRSEAGSATALRLGAEVRVAPEFSVRAGYNIREKKTPSSTGRTTYQRRSAYSLGCGYSSNDSFFCDLALRWNKYPGYQNYVYDVYDEDWNLIYESPTIDLLKKNMDIVLTFGWRF